MRRNNKLSVRVSECQSVRVCHCEESAAGRRGGNLDLKPGLFRSFRSLAMTRILIAVVLIFSFSICPAEESNFASTQDSISLDLKNVDIVELFRIVSLKTGRTIVSSKEVTGRVTIYLSNVIFDDVLDIILLTQGLASYKKGNVYYVMSEVEYKRLYGRDYIDNRKVEMIKLLFAKPSIVFNAVSQLKSDVGKIVVDEASGTIILIDIPEKLELMKKTIKELDRSLDTVVYDLNYAKLADVKIQLGAAITQGTGEVIVDERSGKAIISDLPKKMQKLGALVRELDEDSRQVYVEADIIELTLSDEFQRGIDWEQVFSYATKSGLTFSGYFPATLVSSYQKISMKTFSGDQYNDVLKFLDTYGKSDIISQPRIAVINNEEANVMVGTREAYITGTQSQATSTTVTSESVEFVDVGIKLKIIPRIGSDGFITMKIKPEVSSVKSYLETDISKVPIVQTSQSETVVKVKDGMMIMIAGMTKTELTDTIKGWPVLSRIPFLGIFFGNRDKLVKKSEVIIFLAPHIISGEVNLRGQEITKIIPMEYLPESLQEKVVRDQAIDKILISSEDEKPNPPLPPFAKGGNGGISALAKTAGKPTVVEKPVEVEKAVVVAKPAAPEKPVTKDKPQKIPVSQTVSLDMPKETAKDYYQKGLRAKAGGDNKQAIIYYNKAIALDKNFAPAYNNLGIIYEQEGKSEKAEQAYLRSVEADVKYLPVYSNLALFNEDKGDLAKALEYWRKRISYGDPNDEWTKKAIERIKDLEK